jgi:hypothetical protein
MTSREAPATRSRRTPWLKRDSGGSVVPTDLTYFSSLNQNEHCIGTGYEK